MYFSPTQTSAAAAAAPVSPRPLYLQSTEVKKKIIRSMASVVIVKILKCHYKQLSAGEVRLFRVFSQYSNLPNPPHSSLTETQDILVNKKEKRPT